MSFENSQLEFEHIKKQVKIEINSFLKMSLNYILMIQKFFKKLMISQIKQPLIYIRGYLKAYLKNIKKLF